MKIASSLKSLKKRDLNSKLVRRRGRVYIINFSGGGITLSPVGNSVTDYPCDFSVGDQYLHFGFFCQRYFQIYQKV